MKATIGERIGPAAVEDLRVKALLGTNPLQLNRTKFLAYLEARSEVLLTTLTLLGIEREPALSLIAEDIYDLNDAWRQEAKRINMAKRGTK